MPDIPLLPLLLVDGYALPVIVRCYTEARGRGLAGAVGILAVGARQLRRQVAGWGPVWRVCAIKTVVARSRRSRSEACSAGVNVSAKARSSAFTSW